MIQKILPFDKYKTEIYGFNLFIYFQSSQRNIEVDWFNSNSVLTWFMRTELSKSEYHKVNDIQAK